MNQKIIGCFASVVLPDFNATSVMAKVDTGAYSGAVHCTDIRVVKRGKSRILSFYPYGDSSHLVETELFEETYVRSSTGHRVKRYLVETVIAVEGKEYPITIGLSDRTDLKFEVLLGRRFLREQNILVDTRINQHLDSDGKGHNSENSNSF